MDIADINARSGEVVDAAMRVHTILGPGLLERAYELCLAFELRKRGIAVLTQVPFPIVYESVKVDAGYRVDMLVDGVIIVELETVPKLTPIDEAQLLSYLKLSGRSVGLLINFHVSHLRDGIKRMVNHL